MAVIVSLKMQDDAAFERNFLQLRTYYTDTRWAKLRLHLAVAGLPGSGGGI